MTEKQKKLVENYLCPGCVCGSDTSCGKLNFYNDTCQSHANGTSTFVSSFALGLPSGFNRFKEDGGIYVFENLEEQDKKFPFDIFNLPVWISQNNNDCLVRVVSPRIATVNTIVIADTKCEDIKIHNSATDIDCHLENFNFSPLVIDKQLINSMS